MAQYDLVLPQEDGSAEFGEKVLSIVRGGLLTASADANRVPRWLSGGSENDVVTVDASGDLVFTAPGAGHTQNTDIGTTSDVFELDSDTHKIELTAESASKFGVKVDGGATYADIEAKDAVFNSLSLATGETIDNIEATLTDDDTHLPTSGAVVDYFASQLAAVDAMIFKGTVGSGGTHEIAAFNSLATYNAGWTYRIITAGTIKGVECEIGDLIMAMVDRAGSGEVDADWTVAQTNLDGAVIGPASVTDGYLVQFDGTSGNLIKAGTGVPGTMAYETATDYVADALFDAYTVLYADTDNTPAALTLAASKLVGRAAAGGIAALDGVNVMNIIWVSAPATKTSTGTAGSIAYDGNYLYVCDATDTWVRTIMATNW